MLLLNLHTSYNSISLREQGTVDLRLLLPNKQYSSCYNFTTKVGYIRYMTHRLLFELIRFLSPQILFQLILISSSSIPMYFTLYLLLLRMFNKVNVIMSLRADIKNRYPGRLKCRPFIQCENGQKWRHPYANSFNTYRFLQVLCACAFGVFESLSSVSLSLNNIQTLSFFIEKPI